MSNKIAVIVNAEKSTSSFENGCKLNLYYKDNNNWQLMKDIDYSLDTNISLSEIRDYIRSVILKLEDCKIVIGKTVSGLPYNVFDRMGFAIFEVENISDALLDEIFSEVEASTNERINSYSKLSTSPVETEINGIYFLNLIELQEKHPEISSKKALQSFISSTPFYRLELICSHVPPWFEGYFPQKKLTYSLEELEKNKYKVTIFKKVCEC